MMGLIEGAGLINGLSDVARNIAGITKRAVGYADPAVIAEMNIQVIDLIDRIRGLQDRDLAMQQEKATLEQRVADLERENRQLREFEIDAENYTLEEIAPGSLAYAVKASRPAGQPATYLCVHCFDRKEKSILQFERYEPTTLLLRCPSCHSAIHKTRAEPASAGVTVRGDDYSRNMLNDFRRGM